MLCDGYLSCVWFLLHPQWELRRGKREGVSENDNHGGREALRLMSI